MAKHAVNPDTPTLDCERLRQAEHIVKASIVANDVSHPLEINLSCTLEAAHCLIQDVIEHLGEGKRIKAKLPGEPPTSITGRLLQAAGILKVCILANHEDYLLGEFDFSYPLHAAVTLIDEAHNRLYEGEEERPPKAMREERATEGKPN